MRSCAVRDNPSIRLFFPEEKPPLGSRLCSSRLGLSQCVWRIAQSESRIEIPYYTLSFVEHSVEARASASYPAGAPTLPERRATVRTPASSAAYPTAVSCSPYPQT
eukprot:scaffold301_cov243-Pinguiococcus_pyrenoidosus.AAC.69